MHTSWLDSGIIPALKLDNLTAGYGSAPIIVEVSLSAYAGGIVTILGPNGAGKSTLLKATMGLLSSHGRIEVGGVNLNGLRADQMVRKGVGYVPQLNDIFEPLTVLENLEMGGYLVPKHDLEARIEEALQRFPPLAALRKRRAGNLSGGERKMLAIARVLMNRPIILLLDEPTAHLAPAVARSILSDYVAELASTGVAVVLVEQRAMDALAVSDWAYIMVSGRVEVSGRADDLAGSKEIGEIFLGLRGTAAL